MFRRLYLLVLPFLLLGLAGCGRLIQADSKQSALDPKGPVAQNQYDAFMLTLYVTTFLWVVVGGALLYAVWKFRARKTDDPNFMPKQSHGNPLVEAGLIAASSICLVIIAVPTLRGIVLMKEVPADREEGSIEVNVTGWQWWFEFEYPGEDVITANEFVVPVGRAVKIKLRSGDVIHSFWLPKLAGKVDLVPGQENFIWFQADEEGYYYGQCAEYCGDSHAYMLFRCHVVSEAAYARWLDQQRQDAALPLDTPPNLVDLPEGVDRELVAQGQQVFNAYCVSCHTVGESGGKTGPNLTHFASRSTIAAGWLDNTHDNLYRWVREPDSIKPGNYMWRGVPMPGIGVMAGLAEQQMEPGSPGSTGTSKGSISDEQVRAVVAYLELLK